MNDDSEFHLLPGAWKGHEGSSLQKCYARAFSEARELFIVSAFLTEWPSTPQLNSKCSAFLLVVGADFGTTRRAALQSALKWVPKRFRGTVLAFNQEGVSFHPKAMLWREGDGSCHLLIGSSNLTKAAFNSNVEANVVLQLSEEEYDQAVAWMTDIEERSVVVDDSWLKKYKEAPPRGGRRGGQESRQEDSIEEPIFDLSLGLESAVDRRRFSHFLRQRRAQRAMFDARAKNPLVQLLRTSAAKSRWTEKDNSRFYDELLRLWAKEDTTRMGGLQWVIRGKHSDHQELSKSLIAVLDARPMERDAVVLREKERLQQAGVATRGAVLTELLCHLFPTRYPILDAPVRRWRSMVGFDSRVGGTEGERYLRLARAMRASLKQAGPQELGIADLAELDTLIWFQQNKHKL